MQFPSDLRALDRVIAWISQVMSEACIPTKTRLQLEIALGEGFTNAVRHAHQGMPPEIDIEIEITVLPESLECRIWDRGNPFDLEQKLQTLSYEYDPESPGGHGLKLMRQIADQISYNRAEDNRNCLLLVKQY